MLSPSPARRVTQTTCSISRPTTPPPPAPRPSIAGEEGICKACGVATLSIDYYELGRTTGEMAVKILKGEADISTMAIEYYPNPVKKYNPDMASLYNVTIPSDYEAIG